MCDWKPDESDQDVDQNNLLVTDWIRVFLWSKIINITTGQFINWHWVFTLNIP